MNALVILWTLYAVISFALSIQVGLDWIKNGKPKDAALFFFRFAIFFAIFVVSLLVIGRLV